MKWTPEQQLAIDARGDDLIVSAAAGSGKTAVLVERICQLLFSGEASLDRLIICTFTKAATAEMRSRIEQRLRTQAEHTQTQALRDQIHRLDTAHIGTLHAVCATLLRQYHHATGVDPGFRIEDEALTGAQLRQAAEDALDEAFEAGEDDFIDFARCWGGRTGDALAQLVCEVYLFIRNYPDYLDWLHAAVDCLGRPYATLSDTPWGEQLQREAVQCLQTATLLLREALDIAVDYGIAGYENVFRREHTLLKELQQQPDAVAAAQQALAQIGRLSGKKKTDDELAANQCKRARNAARELLKKHAAATGAQQRALTRTAAMYPQMRALEQLVRRTDALYTQAKQGRCTLDYNDLEQYTLQMLQQTPVAEDIRSALDYVFVDEYQDISPIQDEILRRLSPPGRFFCVGDVKQSIYRFRAAEPQIFIDKLQMSAREGGKGARRVDLAANFRSAPGVIDCVNHLFGVLMEPAFGGVAYADGHSLLCRSARPDTQPPQRPELLVITKKHTPAEPEQPQPDADAPEDDVVEELIGYEREAALVAQRIQAMLGQPIWDAKATLHRPLRYRDIAVLTPLNRLTAAYVRIFSQAGIPLRAMGAQPLFEEYEVDVLVSVLKVVDNRRRDLELLTVLCSVLGGFTYEQLAQIRLHDPQGHFYTALQTYVAQHHDALATRLSAFLQRLQAWRDYCAHAGAGKLLDRICRETLYEEHMAALGDAARRLANIAALLRIAHESDRSLHDFIAHLQRADLSRYLSATPIEDGDAVTMMTVHKSKGLEYPVVFICGAGVRSRVTAEQPLLCHGELGLGPLYANARTRSKAETLPQVVIRSRKHAEALSEWLRLLYVALTRAREKLIIVGTVADATASFYTWRLPLAYTKRYKTATWLDWICSVLVQALPELHLDDTDALAHKLSESGMLAVSIVPAQDIAAPTSSADAAAPARSLLAAAQNTQPDPDTLHALQWRYPHEQAVGLPAKLSVTALLQQDHRHNWRGPLPAPELRASPAFLQPDQRTYLAQERGTLTHIALERLPAGMHPDGVEPFLQQLQAQGILPDDWRQAVSLGALRAFVATDIYAALSRSPRVLRELPFNLLVRAQDVLSGEQGNPSELLVQGIIDCCFIQDGQWVLLDYKTNRADTPERLAVLAAQYRPQVFLYRRALQEITGIPVRASYLYFSTVGVLVEVGA